MKIKSVYIYIGIFVVAVAVLVFADFGSAQKDEVSGKMPNDAIHQGAQMPDDAIHKGLGKDDVPNKENVKPEYYRTLDSLKTAYEKNPADTNVALRYAEYLVAGHGTAKAKAIYDDLVKRYPNSVRVLSEATFVYYQLGDIDKSDELLTRLTKLNPKDLTSAYNLGVVKLMKGDSTSASKIWNDIISKAPNSEEAKASKTALESMRNLNPHNM